jgi:shikimate kinase
MSVEQLKAEIQVLMTQLNYNTMQMRLQHDNIEVMISLMAARVEIYKSVAHRQGLIIEALTNQAKVRRAAA